MFTSCDTPRARFAIERWQVSGPTTVRGAFQLVPSHWTDTGSGSSHQTQGDQTLDIAQNLLLGPIAHSVIAISVVASALAYAVAGDSKLVHHFAKTAFGTGPLRDLIGLPFSTIFTAGSIVALPLAVIAALIMRQPLVARQTPPLNT